MSDELLGDLPRDLPTFLKRFGTDAKCRAYLVRARWPEGFRCAGCGHREAWSHKKRLIEECRSCGRQHSILAGTMFEQTKTGLSKWFLAIYLVTSSKGGISAMELQRQMGFGSYGTAWTWLHKIRRATIRPDREPLQNRVEVDETLVGGARPGKTGRGAAGKTVVVGAVEAKPGPTQAQTGAGNGHSAGCGCKRSRMPRPRASKASSPPTRPSRSRSPPTAGPAIAASRARVTATRRSTSRPVGAMPACGCLPSISSSAPCGAAGTPHPTARPSAGSSAPTTAPSDPSTCSATLTSSSSASTAATPTPSATALPG
jgi:hypothetical protein